MNIGQLMTQPAQTCPRRMPLAHASRRMRQAGCGSLVVVGDDGRMMGIVTDRDMALAIGDTPHAAQLAVERVMSHPVHVCRPEETLDTALARMAQHHVRRLPVVDRGDVKGLVSIEDIVLWGVEQSRMPLHKLVSCLRTLFSAASRQSQNVEPF